jgi:hypothetical protein
MSSVTNVQIQDVLDKLKNKGVDQSTLYLVENVKNLKNEGVKNAIAGLSLIIDDFTTKNLEELVRHAYTNNDLIIPSLPEPSPMYKKLTPTSNELQKAKCVFDSTNYKESDLYKSMDTKMQEQLDEIMEIDKGYFNYLCFIEYKNGRLPDDYLRQLIETEYQILVKRKTEDDAHRIAQNAEIKHVEETNLNELSLKAKLTAKLTEKLNEAFTNGVLIKKCEGGSNPIFGKTKQDCCDSICKKIDNLVNELKEILNQYGTDSLGNNTIAEVVSSFTGKFNVGDKKSNIFKYLKNCKEEKKIDDETYDRVSSKVKWLASFLGIPSEQEGGYYNTKSRTRKNSRKSRGRGHRHRRSSHNKKRHTKRHTKRYRKRK